MQPLRLWVFLAFVAGLRAYDMSQTMVEFYCVMNGNMSDWEQVETDGDSRTLISTRMIPLHISALSPMPIIYLEQNVAGQFGRAHVLVVQEGQEGIVYVDAYELTEDAAMKDGVFDPDKIKSLTWKDLRGEPDCKKIYIHVAPYMFFVNWPNCLHRDPKSKMGSVAVTLTCHKAIMIIPAGGPVKTTLEPYQMKVQGDKYTLDGAPGNFVCHCESQSCRK